VVYDHLIAFGFLEGYNIWVHHGEEISSPSTHDDDIEHNEDVEDDTSGLL